MIGASIVHIRTLYRCMDDGKDSFPTALFVAKKQFPMTMELFMEAIFLLTIAPTVELKWMVIRMSKRIVGVTYENGIVSGVTIDRLNDGTDKAYFKRELHGQWETSSDRPDSLICSVCKCGFDMWKHDPHNYCPHCGVRMDGGDGDAAD